MEITKITNHVLQYDLPQELGYSHQYYQKRTTHLVEVEINEGVTGWGECFGPSTIALTNRTIVENVIQPLILGMNPIDQDAIWHKVYNLMRDHGQKGMPLQALSGVDIALWDIAGKIAGLPGGLHPWKPMLEFDTSDNKFRDYLLETPLDIQQQVAAKKGRIALPHDPGLGVMPDLDFIDHYNIAYC